LILFAFVSVTLFGIHSLHILSTLHLLADHSFFQYWTLHLLFIVKMSPVHDINTGLLVEPTAGFFDGENASTKDLQHLKGLISNAVGRQDVLAKRVEELENQLRVLGASTSRTLIPRYLEHSSQIRALEQRADRAEQGHLTNELRITELECLSPHAGNPRAPTRVWTPVFQVAFR